MSNANGTGTHPLYGFAGASVVIPVGPGHDTLASRAIQSVTDQTMLAKVIVVEDKAGNGAGWARNQGIAQVDTPWTVFLDADDWLEPNAIERMVVWAKQNPTRYVYPDWFIGEAHQRAPETGRAWCNGTWHAITALLPTQWVKAVGGFDESLSGGEDTEFYLKMITSFRCGVRLPEALLHYTADGLRGRAFVEGPQYQSIMAEFTAKYGGKMSCCGQGAEAMPQDVTKMDGDVLCITLWGGNRRVTGKASGRVYPRTGNGKLLWVDPRDLQHMPELFREATAQQQIEAFDALDGIDAIAGAVMEHFPEQKNDRYRPPAKPRAELDLDHIIRMGTEAIK